MSAMGILVYSQSVSSAPVRVLNWTGRQKILKYLVIFFSAQKLCLNVQQIISESAPMHLLKEGTFVPFVKSHFMGPVVFLMVITAPLLTATFVSTALLLQQS